MSIQINPVLPENFWTQDISERSEAELKEWLYKPFILSIPNEIWPNGIRYDVYILNGGCHDRPTKKGSYKTEEEAMDQAIRLSNEYA